MGSDGRSPSTPDAIRPFYPEPSIVTGTLKGFRTSRDGLRRAKPVYARRDTSLLPGTVDCNRNPQRVPDPSRDGLRRAKPVYARRDTSLLPGTPQRVPDLPRWAPTGEARLRPTRRILRRLLVWAADVSWVFLRAGVELVVDGSQVAAGEVGVDLGRADVGVAQH